MGNGEGNTQKVKYQKTDKNISIDQLNELSEKEKEILYDWYKNDDTEIWLIEWDQGYAFKNRHLIKEMKVDYLPCLTMHQMSCFTMQKGLVPISLRCFWKDEDLINAMWEDVKETLKKMQQ